LNKMVEIDSEGESISKTEFEKMFSFFETEAILFQYNKDTDKIELVPINEE